MLGTTWRRSGGLDPEGKAHSDSFKECLRLETELGALHPLKRQSEDYGARAIDAEEKLVECQEDVKRICQLTSNLNGAQTEILAGANKAAVGLGESMGDGVSGLNAAVKEEMAKPGNENEQLKAFAANREDDPLQIFEDRRYNQCRQWHWQSIPTS